MSVPKSDSQTQCRYLYHSFTDGTSTIFAVTSGKNGAGVEPAAFNESSELVFTLTDGTQVNIGRLPGASVPATAAAAAGNGGTGAAIPIAIGVVALSSQLWWLLPLLKRGSRHRNKRQPIEYA